MGKFIKFIIAILTLLTIAGMVLIIFFVSQKTELPEIDGREEVQTGVEHERDVLNDLKRAANNQGEVSFTEADLNHYLAKKIKGQQSGKFNDYVKFKGVWVNLVEDTVECYIEREVTWTTKNDAGKNETFTQDHITQLNISIKTTITESQEVVKEFDYSLGKIGGMQTHGQFIRLAKLPFDNLYKALEEEMTIFNSMNEVHVREGKIELSNKPQVIRVTTGGSSRKN